MAPQIVPKSILGRPGDPPVTDLVFGHLFCSILGAFWPPFCSPFSSDFGLVFRLFSGSALRAPSERLWTDLGTILTPFWLRFGTLLGSLRKVKIELSPKAGAHFHCPRGSENHCFFDLLSERPPEQPLEALLGVLGSILARFWGPLGTLFSTIFRTFF